jgi:hypothetical protein
MDSGALSHMTGGQGKLTRYFPSLSHSSSQIVVGNGSRLPIPGTGYTHLHTPNINFLLASVLHTPSLVSNLISVHKFTKDNWCSVEFDPFGFSVKDLITKTPLLRSSSSGDLYLFAGFSKLRNNFALSTTISNVDPWHRRLGHPSNASLRCLISHFPISCMNNSSPPSVCETCHKGKHVRLSFATSHTITYFPFQIIHCDLWTSPIESVSGFKYYLIVIDDYSHYIWTFPLRLKSDVSSTIREFHHYVRTQFHLSVQAIQCDNRREFDNHALHSFFSSTSIVFRLSCPHMSPQNGKVERGIRSINDIMCTLLLQAHLPPQYLVAALHTTTYLYNQRPSRPLQLQTPYETLFLQPPDYSLLRTFGCLCFPNLSATTLNKLSPRSNPCVFIGYPHEHKDYRCLDLSTNKIITSHHVVFHESIFPFSSQARASSRPTVSAPARDSVESSLDLVPLRPVISPANQHQVQSPLLAGTTAISHASTGIYPRVSITPELPAAATNSILATSATTGSSRGHVTMQPMTRSTTTTPHSSNKPYPASPDHTLNFQSTSPTPAPSNLQCFKYPI